MNVNKTPKSASKLLLLLYFLFSLGLICWECEESFGQEECLRVGRAVECEANEVNV